MREAVQQAVEESAFHAARGVRPPAQRVDPPQIGPLIARLPAAAQRELLTFDDPAGCIDQGVSERMLMHAAGCVHQAVARVPDVRQITSSEGLALDADLGTIPYRDGSKVRLIEEIPFRLAVFDRKMAMIPLDLDVFYNGLLIIRDPTVVNALMGVHRTWWAAGDDPASDRDPRELPAHLAPVLTCLRDGISDQHAAARLRLSPRTYTRRVSELLTLLGVTSRFQAGAAAARRGWI
ncbi:MAG TPA: hypothetical protein VIL71_06020 [Spirillospora sp.]